MFHDWERLSRLVSMRRPQTAGHPIDFVQAINWLWTFLPRLAEVVEPFRVPLEEHMRGIQLRTKRVASGVHFVGAKDYGAATQELEDGAHAVRLHDHAYFW